jgi:hypothetical protein
MDETTYRFSPKVLDRANTIEFNEINLLDLPTQQQNETTSPDEPGIKSLFKDYFLNDEVRKNGRTLKTYTDWANENKEKFVGFLNQLNKDALEKHNLHFGYRIRDEILRYMYFAENLSSDDFTTEIALDFQIKQKILPRIKGTESIMEALKLLRKIIQDKLKSIEKPHSTAKLDQMIEALDRNGYTDFYQ